MRIITATLFVICYVFFFWYFFVSCTSKPQVLENPIQNTCRGPIVVGWSSKAEMSKVDLHSLRTAKLRCQVKFPKSPCLRIFKRTGFQQYQAICGGLKNDFKP